MSISLIVPFLNEGGNVWKTLESISKTVDSEIEVIIINDASEDGYDYEQCAKYFEVEYIRNSFRLGVAGCRELGIKMASYDTIVLLDAHMQFYDQGWEKLVLELVEREPQTIFCSKSIHLNTDWEREEGAPLGCGAFIPLKKIQDFQSLSWLLHPTNDNSIPCIFGACYCFSKRFYEKIGGLVGLLQWGGDEQFLSAKAFMAGGRCALIPELAVGHVYRESCPYEFIPALNLYNQLYILSVLQSQNQAKKHVEAILNSLENKVAAEGVRQMLVQSEQEITQYRDYYLEHLDTRSFEDFLEYNARFVESQ